jgi:hypothetical protein
MKPRPGRSTLGRSALPACSTRHAPPAVRQAGQLVGWFSSRPRSMPNASMREAGVTASLARVLRERRPEQAASRWPADFPGWVDHPPALAVPVCEAVRLRVVWLGWLGQRLGRSDTPKPWLGATRWEPSACSAALHCLGTSHQPAIHRACRALLMVLTTSSEHGGSTLTMQQRWVLRGTCSLDGEGGRRGQSGWARGQGERVEAWLGGRGHVARTGP